MASRAYLLPVAAVLGLAGGFGAGSLAGRSGPAAPSAAAFTPSAVVPRSGGAKSHGHEPAAQVSLVKPGPLPKSTDTVESLLQLERGPLYARLGLWLLDATEEDMTAFWEGYYKREDPNDTIKDLLFTQWGKKNAAGMLAVARRTGCEVSAMWSWAMSDPQGMLAYVEGKDPKMRNFGLRGLAFFHPELARQMLEQDPTLANTFEMEQLAAQLGKGDPKAEIEFLSEHHREDYYIRQALNKWAAKDPYHAFEWLNERGGIEDYERREFFESVRKERPEALPELAAMLPDGNMRREIEAAAFRHLAETDPDKAVEEAGKIEAPRLAAERLSMLGKIFADKDPSKALEILSELYAKCPDVAGRMTWVRYPDGSASGGGGVAGFSEFITALASKEPQTTMQSLLELEARSQPEAGSNPYAHELASRQLAENWARKDLEGFTAWSEAQATPELRDMGARVASEQLRDKKDFANAAAWALRISEPAVQGNTLSNLLSYWNSSDKAAAQSWLEQTELPENTREYLKKYFRPSN